jgi:hypothetical protein
VRRTGDGALRRAVAVALAAMTGAAAGIGTCLASAPAAGAAQSSAASGIGATWTTAEGSWATLPMGHLHTASNTFWELLYRPAGSARWTLVTPPGVASNGGIVGVSTPAAAATVTVGFQPAKYLLYSPVARTTDAGRIWSTGTLPLGLAQVASSLATGSGDHVLALERAKGGTLVRAAGSLTHWSTTATEQALAATSAGTACGLRALSAVTVVSGSIELGGDCTKPGVVGLFSDDGGSWQADGPGLAQESRATMQVLRLTSTQTGTAALVLARSTHSESLIALWRQRGQTWAASPPVHVEGRVLSAGITASLSVVALTATASGGAEVHSVAGDGVSWTSAAVPRGTQAVVAPGDSGTASDTAGLTALAISGSWVTVWNRTAGSWRKGARFKVPIEYGSST